MNTLSRIVFALEAVVDYFGRFAAWVCVALAVLVSASVLARYFFSFGTMWLQELEWHLISPIAMLGMSYSLMKGDQVRVDVLYERMTARQKIMMEVVTGLLLVIFSVIMIRLSWPFVMQAYQFGEGSPNPGGLPYRFLLKAFMPLGFALLAIQGLCHVLKQVTAWKELTHTDGGARVAQ